MTLDDLINFYDSSIIFSVLKKGGGDHRFVGGCVRNILAGIPVNDVDIATTLLPDQVESLFNEADIKTLDVGKEHGTIIALVNNHSYEITTLRKDIETDGRHAVVSFSQDWKEDAQRRDFTINAMSYDPHKRKLYDYYGGEEDLKKGIVRFVGDPDQRVKEDYLRILRFFRFYAIYGNNEDVDNASLEACKNNAHNIKTLSAERKREEFAKILSVDPYSNSIELMFDTGVLSALFEHKLERREFLDHIHSLNNIYLRANQNPPILLKIFLIADKNYVDINNLEHIFRFSRKQNRYIKSVKRLLNKGLKHIKDNLYFLIYEDADLLLDCVYYISAGDGVEYTDLLKEVRLYKDRSLVMPVTGEDIMDIFDIPSGAGVGEFLSEAEEFWCSSKFTATRESVLNFLKNNSK